MAKSPFIRVINVRNGLVLLAAITLYQYVTQGSVTWPLDTLHKIEDTLASYAVRPEAGWRKAADKIEGLGEKREGHPTPDFDLTGRVVGIADGDTVSILEGTNRQHIIRLFGIDTPEWDQPHGKTAKKALSGLLARRMVGVVTVEKDSFGRTVGTVYLDDTNINLVMVEDGHAWWYKRYAPYERHLAAAERAARDNKLGLWTNPDPIPPWVWRRRH